MLDIGIAVIRNEHIFVSLPCKKPKWLKPMLLFMMSVTQPSSRINGKWYG